MQYNDTRIQYDSSLVNYEGSWALAISESCVHSETIAKRIQKAISEIATHSEVLAKKIQNRISEIASHIETDTYKIGVHISEIATHSESISRVIRKVISETSTHSETIVKSIHKVVSETVNHSEISAIKIQIKISETINHTEKVLRKIAHHISETVTHSEAWNRTIRLVISETALHVETVLFDIFGRLHGVIGMIKEFVRIGDKKEKATVTNIGQGVREQLNVIERQFDDASVLYDNPNVCYNNYISSEKPIFAIGKKYNQVSVSFKKDKPSISKK